MRISILSIGDELTSGVTVDTNASWLAARMVERGAAIAEIRAVADDRGAIAGAIRELAGRSEVLLVSGGLGPTPDDLTREALGDVVDPGGEPLLDEAALAAVEKWFARSGRTMPEANRKQAMRPRGATMIPNANGTAPGVLARLGGCAIVLMPGVPREMKPMFETVAREHLAPAPDRVTVIRAVHTCGIGESALAERLGDILARTGEPRIGTSAALSVVSVRVYATGRPEEAARLAQAEIDRIEPLLRPFVYGRDQETLASSLGSLLLSKGMTLATAESCTGGLLGQMITEVAGSSEWYRGGWVTYSNELKQRELAVPQWMLERHGAVSAEVARAMAEGAVRKSGADIGLAITGVAGPSGGSEAKPAGTVFIGCACRAEQGGAIESSARRYRFSGERGAIRERSAKSALQMARFRILCVGGDAPLLGEVIPSSGSDA